MSENNESKKASEQKIDLKAGRDLKVGNINQIAHQVVEQEAFFSPLDLEEVKPPYKVPPKTNALIKIIKDLNLLFLGNGDYVETVEIAKFLGLCIQNEKNSDPDAEQLVVQEWQKPSGQQRVHNALQETKQSSVFILSGVKPEHISSQELTGIWRAAISRSHYVILTTSHELDDFKLPSRLKPCWQELQPEDDPNHEHYLNDEDEIKDWYNELDSRQKLIALGLSFFDGLLDDQFFAALEEIVETVWQRRDPSLRALDYFDLLTPKFNRFFSFTNTTDNKTFVKIRFPNRRQILFKVAWVSHRRQILAALPVLVKLVKNSVRSFKRELYGSSVRCDQIRRVVTQTISDIGLVANQGEAIEAALLDIASDEDINVQLVAARALALRRDRENRKFIIDERSEKEIDEQLFEVLVGWKTELRFSKLVGEILKHQKNTKDAIYYIQATVALTVGAAALYDRPDKLSPKLCELVKQLASEKNELVRDRFSRYTLPTVVRAHTIQFRDILYDLLLKYGVSLARSVSESFAFAYTVAGSLAIAYSDRSDDVLEILNLWTKECIKKRSDKVDISRVTFRDVLITTVVLTYGEIEYDSTIGSLSTQQAFSQLRAILSQELHPFVRQSILFAVGRQSYRSFEHIDQQLQSLVTEITTEERRKVAEILADIYLDQRADLSGGDISIEFTEVKKRKYNVWLNVPRPVTEVANNEIRTRTYRVWLNSLRPLTVVEEAMLRWAKDDENAMAQQVATNASAIFAVRFDQGEERLIKRLREEREPSKIAIYADPIVSGQPPKDWYFGKLIPWLATRNAEDYRISIRNLLPEGLRQRWLRRDVMEFVLKKWANHSDDDNLKTISGRLKLGLWLTENLVWLTALGIGSTLTLVWLVAINLSQVRKTEPIVQKIEPSDPNIIIVSDRIGVEVFDTTSFNTGNLTIKISEGATPDDYLGIRNQGRNSGEIGVNGSEVTYGGTVIGLFKGGSLKEPLVISFNSNAKLPVVQALLQNITYKNTATTLNEGSRKVEFQITDEAGKVSQLLSRTVFVTHDNIDPTLVVPESLSANENQPIKVSGITINDSDSTKKFTVTLSANNGSITVKDSIPKGIVVSDISDNNTKNVKFTGSLDKIKATLTDDSAIIYKGTDDDNFKVTVDDGGQDVPGDPITTLVWPPKAKDAKTASKDIKISVALLNKPPVITIPEPSKTTDENKELIISGIGIDDDTKDLTVTLSAEHGTVTVKPDVAKGVVIDNISNNKTKKVVITGELAKIKSTLSDTQAIVYKGDQDFSGNDSLTIVVDDKGRGKTDKLSIIVNRIKRPPILKFLTDIATATPPSLPVPSPNVTEIKISKQEALDAVQNYLQAKGSIFAPPFSREIAAKVSTGTLYLDITKSEGSIDSLIKNQQFYRYGAREVKVLDYFTSDSSKAFIDLIITEEAARFKNGNLELAPSVSTKKYRYELRKDNNILKVFDYKD